jgi:hypothetical protein
MRFTLAASLVLILTCSGCDSFKQGFTESFDSSYKQSCRDKVMQKGIGQQDAEKYCDCTLAKFKETKSMDEAAKTCIAELKLGANR